MGGGFVSRGRELLVGFVIIAAVVVGVGGSLWLKGTNWGRPAVPVEAGAPATPPARVSVQEFGRVPRAVSGSSPAASSSCRSRRDSAKPGME